MIRTWQNHDISRNSQYKNNYISALKNIKAQVLLMPGINDLYFPPEDNQIEIKHLKNAQLSVIRSDYGHYAGAGKSKKDLKFINEQLFKYFG